MIGWVDLWLRCQRCGAVATRPQGASRECRWCKLIGASGELKPETEVEHALRIERQAMIRAKREEECEPDPPRKSRGPRLIVALVDVPLARCEGPDHKRVDWWGELYDDGRLCVASAIRDGLCVQCRAQRRPPVVDEHEGLLFPGETDASD